MRNWPGASVRRASPRSAFIPVPTQLVLEGNGTAAYDPFNDPWGDPFDDPFFTDPYCNQFGDIDPFVCDDDGVTAPPGGSGGGHGTDWDCLDCTGAFLLKAAECIDAGPFYALCMISPVKKYVDCAREHCD
jgi:hypothetical protein